MGVKGERMGGKQAERWNCLGNYFNMQEKDCGWFMIHDLWIPIKNLVLCIKGSQNKSYML